MVSVLRHTSPLGRENTRSQRRNIYILRNRRKTECVRAQIQVLLLLLMLAMGNSMQPEITNMAPIALKDMS